MPRPALAKPRSAATGGADDAALLARLRAGEDAAFDALVGRHQTAMIRVAELYVPSRAVAEEVAQETWLAARTLRSGSCLIKESSEGEVLL